MIKKFWIGILVLLLFVAGCLAVVIATAASFVGLVFGVLFGILAFLAFCFVKASYSDIKTKIKEEEENDQKKTKRLFAFSFVIVASIIIAIGAIVEIGFGYASTIDLNARAKKIAESQIDKEVCESVLLMNRKVSSLRWNEKVCFAHNDELKKATEKCDEFIANEAKSISNGISELKPLKKIKSSEHNRKIENTIVELELDEDNIFEAKVKENVSNYSDLEEYKIAYSNLLATYKVGCYSCGGDGHLNCINCNGTGLVKFYYGDSDLQAYLEGHDPYTVGDCPLCDGTGDDDCKRCSNRGYYYEF